MEYNESSWAAVDRLRRDIRDTTRDAFFSEASVTPTQDPFDWNPDGQTNLDHVRQLIEFARKIHQGDTSGIEALHTQVLGSVLGVGGLGSVGTLKYANHLITALKGPHFLGGGRE